MKKTLVTLATAVTMIGLAAPANADVDQFANDLDRIGIGAQAPPGTIGRGICSDLYGGDSPATVAAHLYRGSANGQGFEHGITLSQARQVVQAAINDLCPDAG